LITSSKVNVKPTLKIIELPRLKALIEEILKISPNLTVNEIQNKLGDVAIEDVRKSVYKLVAEGIIEHSPDKTYRKYWMAKKNRNEIENE
jgi:ATP-dependent DNA helicase RecG